MRADNCKPLVPLLLLLNQPAANCELLFLSAMFGYEGKEAVSFHVFSLIAVFSSVDMQMYVVHCVAPFVLLHFSSARAKNQLQAAASHSQSHFCSHLERNIQSAT